MSSEIENFSEFVNSTKSLVLNTIGKYLYSRFYNAIDDVAQEVYFRAYKQLSSNKFRNEAKLETWLYTIAKNESLRMNKKLLKKEKQAVEFMNEVVENEEQIIALYEAVSTLPEHYREIFRLKLLVYSEAEIAQKTDLNKGTVKLRTSRGLKLLAQNMENF